MTAFYNFIHFFNYDGLCCLVLKSPLGNTYKVCVYVCLYSSVLETLRMHIPTYAALLRVSVSLILCTATRFLLNIFDDRKVGF